MSWVIYFKKYIFMGVFVFNIPEFTIVFVSPEMIDIYPRINVNLVKFDN